MVKKPSEYHSEIPLSPIQTTNVFSTPKHSPAKPSTPKITPKHTPGSNAYVVPNSNSKTPLGSLYSRPHNVSRQLFSPDKSDFEPETPAKKILANKSERISVFLRIKPIPEKSSSFEQIDDNTISIIHPGTKNSDKYFFDHIFPSNATQVEVYNKTTESLIRSLFDGQSSLLFAYGVTNSGKTHTIVGTQKDPGLIPRSLDFAFELLNTKNKLKDSDDFEFCITVSYAEIYNELIFDLLSDYDSKDLGKKRKPLTLNEDQTGRIFIKGIREIEIIDAQDGKIHLMKGNENRHVAETLLNQDSSRSHSVFTIRLMKKFSDAYLKSNPSTPCKYIQISEIGIVDLAGSERNSRTNTRGERLKEASSINQSLTVLGRCLQVMRWNQRNPTKHQRVIPFRESKITRMFYELLSKGRVVMIVNVSPAQNELEETTAVMRYSAVAKDIYTGSKVDTWRSSRPLYSKPNQLNSSTVETNVRPSLLSNIIKAEQDVLIEQLRRELESLKETMAESELNIEARVREEAAAEMEERFHEMEQNLKERLENQILIYENKYQKKIELYKKSIERFKERLQRQLEHEIQLSKSLPDKQVSELKKQYEEEMEKEEHQHQTELVELQMKLSSSELKHEKEMQKLRRELLLLQEKYDAVEKELEHMKKEREKEIKSSKSRKTIIEKLKSQIEKLENEKNQLMEEKVELQMSKKAELSHLERKLELEWKDKLSALDAEKAAEIESLKAKLQESNERFVELQMTTKDLERKVAESLAEALELHQQKQKNIFTSPFKKLKKLMTPKKKKESISSPSLGASTKKKSLFSFKKKSKKEIEPPRAPASPSTVLRKRKSSELYLSELTTSDAADIVKSINAGRDEEDKVIIVSKPKRRKLSDGIATEESDTKQSDKENSVSTNDMNIEIISPKSNPPTKVKSRTVRRLRKRKADQEENIISYGDLQKMKEEKEENEEKPADDDENTIVRSRTRRVLRKRVRKNYKV